jgi:SAM-dependent methyltransferase
MVKMLVLDVGCRRRPKGNVNVDVSKDYFLTIPRKELDKGDKVIRFMDIKEIPNFMLASVYYLPFRERVFDRVTSSHLLEHLENPILALREMIRACKGEIDISIPHRFSAKIKAKERGHVSFLNTSWFIKVFRILGINDYDIVPHNRCLPHPILPLFAVPESLKIHFWVKPQEVLG